MFFCYAKQKYGCHNTCGWQCSPCKTDYRFGFDYPNMEPIAPTFQLPAIPLKVEYTPWRCVHGHEHIMITITEINEYEITDRVTGVTSSSGCWATVRLW